jgi:hypothetical protein
MWIEYGLRPALHMIARRATGRLPSRLASTDAEDFVNELRSMDVTRRTEHQRP